MKPPTATAAWTARALIESSIIRFRSARVHSSAVIGHGHPGSSNRQRWAISGPSTTRLEKSILWPAIRVRNFICAGVKISAMGFLPMATRLMWPLSTGIENDADLTSDVSLASASILKSGYRRHFGPTSAGLTGRNFTVLSCASPTTRRARAMIPAPSRSSFGVSKK